MARKCQAFATKQRGKPDAVWNSGYLPGLAERDIFKAAKKVDQRKSAENCNITADVPNKFNCAE